MTKLLRPRSLRDHFLVLVIGTLIPLAVILVVAVFYLARAEFRSNQRGLQDTARALAEAIDREILSSVTTLEALASSELIDRHNLSEFYRAVVRVVPTQPGWRTVMVHDPAGRNVLHTSFAFGTPGPGVVEPKSFNQLVRTLHPTVTNFTVGPVSGPAIAVRVPVLRGGHLKYVLTASIDASLLDQLLKRQQLPRGWYSVVYDKQRAQIASSTNAEIRRGDITGRLIAQVPASTNEAWVAGTNRAGIESYGAFTKAPLSGYYVSIVVPRSELTRTLLQSTWIISVVVCLGLAMTLLTLRWGRRLKSATEVLVDIARSIGTEKSIASVAPNSIDEINVIADALIETSDSLKKSNSERAKSEAELRESERRAVDANQRIQAITDKMAAAVTCCSRELRYIWVSRQYADWLGKDYSNIVGKPIIDVIGKAGFDFIHPYIERVLKGEDVVYEAALDLPQGKRWITAAYRPMYDDGGIVDGWIAAILDITKRKEIEEALRASEERFRVMFALAAVGQAKCDLPTGKFVAANEKFCAITGYRESELLSLTPVDLLHVEDRQRGQEMFDGLISGKSEGYVTERRYVRKDGKVIWVSVAVNLIRNELGVPVCAVGAVNDITQRKEMEREIREADLRKDQFIAMLSHELRNPLAPITNAVAILRSLGPTDPTIIWCRDLIAQQVKLMNRVLEDLLDVSRITRSQLQLRNEPMDLRVALRDAIQTSQPSIEARGHRLIVDLPENEIPVIGDTVRLTQVFSNILNNAAKYMDVEGEIRVTARLATALPAEANGAKKEVVVSIKDSGIGIAPEELPRLFEMFSQVESALTRSQGGLGIGLSLVKGLVDLHGGSVTAYSEGLGKGSTFVVRLPIAIDQDQPPANLQHQSPTKVLPKRRVLVVDDNLDQTRSLAMLLNLLGMSVHVANDGPTALEAVKVFSPEVALIDIGLPGMDGYQLARLIRVLPNSINMKLIAQTGWGRDQDREKAKDAGFDFHLTKPIDHNALENILSQC